MAYYLWGAVKHKCYLDKPETIDALKDNIREALDENKIVRWRTLQVLEGNIVVIFEKIIYIADCANIQKRFQLKSSWSNW